MDRSSFAKRDGLSRNKDAGGRKALPATLIALGTQETISEHAPGARREEQAGGCELPSGWCSSGTCVGMPGMSGIADDDAPAALVESQA
jgi:hypothetical protein